MPCRRNMDISCCRVGRGEEIRGWPNDAFCFDLVAAIPIRRFSTRSDRSRKKRDVAHCAFGAGAAGPRSLGRGRKSGSAADRSRDREDEVVARSGFRGAGDRFGIRNRSPPAWSRSSRPRPFLLPGHAKPIKQRPIRARHCNASASRTTLDSSFSSLSWPSCSAWKFRWRLASRLRIRPPPRRQVSAGHRSWVLNPELTAPRGNPCADEYGSQREDRELIAAP